MKNHIKLITFIGIILLLLLLSSCTNNREESDKLKAALVTSGPVDDGGWNKIAYDGLKSLEEEGFYVEYSDSVSKENQKQVIDAYAKKDFDYIITHGHEWEDAVKEKAKEYPDIKFLQTAGSAAEGMDLANLVSVQYKAYELGYLAGHLAGNITNSKKVAMIGAEEIPTTVAEVEAIDATLAKYYNGVKFDTVYTGSWTDVKAGKDNANILINNGYDVIIGIGDASDKGALEAIDEANAKGKNVSYIGWSGDFNKVYGDHYNFIASSLVQGIDKTIYEYGLKVKNDEFVGGALTLSAADGMLYYGEFKEGFDETLKNKLLGYQKELEEGKYTGDELYKELGMEGKTPYFKQPGE